jgi:alkanesulfonate monooxygenase SsuD/methylene tetrahydromethanopterin reductase-like flavin-dependent oxidoreductase (luciferase family)
MQLDIFSELQSGRPVGEIDSPRLLAETLEQARAADAAGFGCWWTVEHHSAASFSVSSAPEMVLTAIATQTDRIRLGTSGILAPFAIHHPIRLAERAAWLDVISGGRLELGLARSGGAEWEAFGVDGDRTRAEIAETFRMLPRMWIQDAFAWESEWIQVPEREIVPKPVQRPHPPLWQTVTGPESCGRAGRLGVGMLGSALFSPLWHVPAALESHRRGLAETEAAPESVNRGSAMFTFVHCAESRQAAIESRAAEAALWFMNEAPSVFRVPRDNWLGLIRGVQGDGGASLPLLDGPEAGPSEAELNDPVPLIALMNRQRAGQRLDPVEVFEVVEAYDTCVIGDVETCVRKLRAFEETGLDRVMCLMQFGQLPHAAVLRSIELMGKAVLPVFA